MNILYEDNHLIVIEKPYNMPSQSDSSKDPDVLRMVKDYLVEKYNKPGDAYVGLVSRLDRPCGGVMILAKTSKAASRLTEAFSKHDTVRKEYLAVIDGILPEDEGVLEDELLKDRRTNTVKAVKKGTPDAKHAQLEYRALSRKENLTLVKIRLITGRPHQIRVQFSSRGYPLYGDQRYNPDPKPHAQLALWSYSLALIHPVKKEPLVITEYPKPTAVWKLFEEEINAMKES